MKSAALPTGLPPAVERRLRAVHRLSRTVNGRSRTRHTAKLLSLMEEHAAEIADLYAAGDPHFLVEIGDLLILCLEMLVEHRRPIGGTLDICLGRYERKLNGIVQSAKCRVQGSDKDRRGGEPRKA